MRLFAFCVLCLFCAISAAAPPQGGDLRADTWVATDALGRSTPPWPDAPLRPGRTVGMFYFLWLGEHGTQGPYDISKLLAENPDDPKYGPRHVYHWWGEPEAGYYLSRDPWVVARHMSMLADAGVDTLIFDVTNGPTYTENYLLVCKTLSAMRARGERTPQVMFITWSHSPDVVKRLYTDFYAKNLYPDLWFRWQGKPLILGDPDAKMDDGSSLPAAIRDFFTWRLAWFQPAGYQAGYHKWTWGSTSPQDFAWDKAGIPEEVSVSVATHPTGNNGRSHHDGFQPPYNRYKVCPETPLGLFFGEQWERALKIDPAFVFVTGWNEWQAMRFLVGTPGVEDPARDAPVGSFLGKPTRPGGSYFVDEYNEEFSRDIEPMKGGHADDYYYQLVSYVRRYKGARRPELPGRPKTVRLDKGFDQWQSVASEYRDTEGDTMHRDFDGWGTHYTNATGRNDFVRLKVARDGKNVWFYARTRGKISPRAGRNWMVLFLDTDLDPFTGWNGYDYAVNLGGVSARTTTLKRNLGGWRWASVAQVPYRVSGNELMIQVPRALIGQGKRDVALDFHWADNFAGTGDLADLALNGDSAPNRRFNYRYAAFTPGPLWEFRTNGFAEGWSAGPTALAVRGGALSGEAGVPVTLRAPSVSVEAGANRYVALRLRAKRARRAAFAWTGAKAPVAFPLIPDGRFHSYVLDLGRNPNWRGWVKNLSLSFPKAPGCFAVDYVRVRPESPVPSR